MEKVDTSMYILRGSLHWDRVLTMKLQQQSDAKVNILIHNGAFVLIWIQSLDVYRVVDKNIHHPAYVCYFRKNHVGIYKLFRYFSDVYIYIYGYFFKNNTFRRMRSQVIQVKRHF